MDKNKTRLTAVVGTTMALVIAGTAAVSAHPGERGDRGDRGAGMAGMAMGAKQGAPGMGARQGGPGMRGLDDDFERRETTVQTADGVSIQRVEQGVVDSASDTGLEFSLASGESVTVTFDDDTQLVAFEEQELTDRRGRSRNRVAPTEIEASDLAAGTEIVVWSSADDGTDFMADRVVVEPAAEAAADAEATDAEDADAETEAVEETTTEEAASTDA
jgi:hypothetical protein